MFSKVKISECDRSSGVERQVEALRVGGAIPSGHAILCLVSSVAERAAHTGVVNCSIQLRGTKSEAGDQGERGRLLSGIKPGSIPGLRAIFQPRLAAGPHALNVATEVRILGLEPFLLGLRLMAGHATLDRIIYVRVVEPEPIKSI